jgi:hypothetical protein
MKKVILIFIAVVLGGFLAQWILGFVLIAGGSVYGQFDQWRYKPTEEFRESDWKRPDLKYRYSVLDHVAAKVVAVGMKREDVERVLGKPNSITQKGEWQYETQRPGWYFIDFSGGGLLVEFDAQGRVSRVSKNLWVD